MMSTPEVSRSSRWTMPGRSVSEANDVLGRIISATAAWSIVRLWRGLEPARFADYNYVIVFVQYRQLCTRLLLFWQLDGDLISLVDLKFRRRHYAR